MCPKWKYSTQVLALGAKNVSLFATFQNLLRVKLKMYLIELLLGRYRITDNMEF